jgi:geranylgeranyl diphosphate synthase type I
MYLEMIGKKTAALMACATQVGALLSTDDESVIETYRTFGYELGLVFQIVDDVLGIWGLGEATGKAVGEDIVNRKKSLPIVYALQRSQRLREIYAQPQMDPEQQLAVMDTLDAVSARDYAHQLAAEHLDLAVATLESTGIENTAQARLRDIARFLLERQH